MVFLFIIDVITSATLHIVVSCGSWIVCKSANGACYLYSKLKNKNNQSGTEAASENVRTADVATIIGLDAEYVVITREEYNRLRSECKMES